LKKYFPAMKLTSFKKASDVVLKLNEWKSSKKSKAKGKGATNATLEYFPLPHINWQCLFLCILL